MDEVTILNTYIKNILNEVSEINKKRLLVETQKELLEAQLNVMAQENAALKEQIVKLDAKPKKKIE